MGRVSATKRKMAIRQVQKRQKKLAKLRQNFLAAKNSLEKEKILEKVQKIAPWLTQRKFLASSKEEVRD
jgi:hypothetical protein